MSASSISMTTLAERRGSGKANLSLSSSICGDLDLLQLLQCLEPALDLLRLRGLVAEAVDELLDVGDLPGLARSRGLGHSNALLAEHDELGETAHVLGGGAAGHLDHPLCDVVDEIAVVGNEEQRSRPGRELLLEPQHRVDVEVVGRLVEHQDVRLLEQEPGQRCPHLPAAGHLGQRAIHVGRREPEASQNSAGLWFEVIATELFELALDDAVLVHHLVVGIAGGRRHSCFERPEFDLEVEHVTGALQHLFENRTLPDIEQLLREIADTQVLLATDIAGIGFLGPDDDLQERRLADTVATDQGDSATVDQPERDVAKEGSPSETFGQTSDRQHWERLSALHGREGPVERDRHRAPYLRSVDAAERAAVGSFIGIVAVQFDQPDGVDGRDAFHDLDGLRRVLGDNDVADRRNRVRLDEHELTGFEGRLHARTLDAETPPAPPGPLPELADGVDDGHAVGLRPTTITKPCTR